MTSPFTVIRPGKQAFESTATSLALQNQLLDPAARAHARVREELADPNLVGADGRHAARKGFGAQVVLLHLFPIEARSLVPLKTSLHSILIDN